MTAGEAMAAALHQMVEREQRPPCGVHQVEHLWTSEDHIERAKAARLCVGCQVFKACTDVAAELRPSFGVWAGRDRTPRGGGPHDDR